MFSKLVLNPSIRFRWLLINEISFKRYFTSFDNKLFESRFNCHNNHVMNVRQFCDKTNNDINKSLKEIKFKSIAKQNESPIEIIAKKVSKRKEFFYVILKKPNELMEWIEKTPPEKKKNFILSAIIKYLLKPLGVLSALYLVFYFANSEENPITGRSCTYSIPPDMEKEIEDDIFKEIFTQNMKNHTFLPSTDPIVKRLDNCFNKLIDSNNDLDVIGEGNWSPIVINDDKICDVIVLKESQNVFVYKKMLELCQTDDELAYVLAHQLSHIMLDHKRELTSYANIIFMPLIALLPKLWILERDAFRFDIFEKVDLFVENMIKNFIRITLSMSPYNEEMEEEADRIAMQLMTRSCYDIRKCRQFCKRYKSLSEVNSKSGKEDKRIELFDEKDFFGKHPINDQKLLYLFQYIKPFIELRKECNCEPLVK